MIVDSYHRVWAHSDETIDSRSLEDIGRVPRWPSERSEMSLHLILVHLTTETQRHAGHIDIVRKLIDDTAGLRAATTNLPTETTHGGPSAAPHCRPPPTSSPMTTETSSGQELPGIDRTQIRVWDSRHGAYISVDLGGRFSTMVGHSYACFGHLADVAAVDLRSSVRICLTN